MPRIDLGHSTVAVQVDNLVLADAGGRPLVDEVSLAVAAGESLGIVGESGSGKSLTLRSILGLLPRGVSLTSGTVSVGGRVGMVFQDPLTALDPLSPVGAQVAEVSRYARGLGREQSRTHARELFGQVGLGDDPRRFAARPFELSGGQRQRVVIAMALASDPQVLLCDEPTTALDVTVQRQILDLLNHLRVARGLSMVFVSHDLAVVAQVCSRLVVMREGRIVEEGPIADVLFSPRAEYTRALLRAIPELPALDDSGTTQGSAVTGSTVTDDTRTEDTRI